jgi:Tol biopolymer transport system component
MRLLSLVVCVVSLLLLGACSGKGGDTANQQAAPTAQSLAGIPDHGLLLPRDQRLLLREMKDNKEFVIKPPAPPNSYYTWPRWSPDGKQIAYVVNQQYTGLPNQDWGGNIAVSAPDGSNERIVFKRPAAGVSIEGLAWAHDGRGFFAGFLETTIRDGRFIGQTLKLDYLDIATGARRTLFEDAAYPTTSPDGARIAYVTFSNSAGPGGLWTAKPDGSDRKMIVETSGRFLGILSPRFSPGGHTIAFAAVATNADADPRRDSRFAFRWPWQARPAAAHGLPMDIWTVPVSGGDPRKLSDILEDEPSPAWSPDGAEIAIIATGGLYVVPAAGGETRKVGLGGTQTQIDWR